MAVALQGEQGKPDPALVIQADGFDGLSARTVPPFTGISVDAPLIRIGIKPTSATRPTRPCRINIERPQTPPCIKIGPVIGWLGNSAMLAVILMRRSQCYHDRNVP